VGQDQDACCGACGHAAEVARGGGPAPNPHPHLRFEVRPDGVPVGVEIALLEGVRAEDVPRLVIPVDRPYLALGRVPPADIVIPMSVLSRRQCGFSFSTGQAILEDLRSSCGTYVNGARVQRAALRPGDRVLVGNLVLEVRLTPPG